MFVSIRAWRTPAEHKDRTQSWHRNQSREEHCRAAQIKTWEHWPLVGTCILSAHWLAGDDRHRYSDPWTPRPSSILLWSVLSGGVEILPVGGIWETRNPRGRTWLDSATQRSASKRHQPRQGLEGGIAYPVAPGHTSTRGWRVGCHRSQLCTGYSECIVRSTVRRLWVGVYIQWLSSWRGKT